MTIILLCGGYATRLYPCQLNGPKSLLVVNGRTLIDRILDDFRTRDGELVPGIDRIIIVTSRRFYLNFDEWLKSTLAGKRMMLVCDGTDSDADKLGAVRDLSLALRTCVVTDNLIVISPDNLFTDPLDGFLAFLQSSCSNMKVPAIATYDVGSKELARNYGVVSIAPDGDRRFVKVKEKPAEPESTIIAVGLYYFPANWVTQIHAYLDSGGKPDAPGHLIEHVSTYSMINRWPLRGQWFDIGSKEALDQARRIPT